MTETEHISELSLTKDTPYLILAGKLWGSFGNICENIDRVIMALHCTSQQGTYCQWQNMLQCLVDVFIIIFWYQKLFNFFNCILPVLQLFIHDDIIKWKHFPYNWPFVQGIHQSPVNSLYKGKWCRALVFSLSWGWTNGWVNNHKAGDLRCHHAHYDVTAMSLWQQRLYQTESSVQEITQPTTLPLRMLVKQKELSWMF